MAVGFANFENGSYLFTFVQKVSCLFTIWSHLHMGHMPLKDPKSKLLLFGHPEPIPIELVYQ